MALEKSHIQNLIVNGYDYHCCRYLLLNIQNPAATRQFLQALLDGGWLVSAAASRASALRLTEQQRCPVGIGFTFQGLQRLQLPTPYLHALQDRAPAFAEGAYRRAAHRLADTGPSAAELWEPSFHPHAAHVFLTLHADTQAELAYCQATLQTLSADAFTPAGWDTPIAGDHLQPHTHDRKKRRVHFGYLDGIANPLIKHLHADRYQHSDLAVKPTLHEPGEFLLGHGNDEGYNRWLVPTEPLAVRQFFANSSFSAFRKMAQDEGGFRHFVDVAKDVPGIPSAEYVRAKLVGRWHDGRVVTATSPEQPDPAAHHHGTPSNTALNDFDFSQDPQGLGCPFGAHIRRMNPRKDPVVPFRRRPVIRRGIPYGPAYSADTATAERGLLGLFFCASIEDQFEHLLSEWGNKNPFGLPNRSTAKDPLIGNHEGDGGLLDIPTANGAHQQIGGFTPFVTTRGSLYTFFPSLPAMAMLAQHPSE
jgi:deferrochelatase/peroxidase EfeB